MKRQRLTSARGDFKESERESKLDERHRNVLPYRKFGRELVSRLSDYQGKQASTILLASAQAFKYLPGHGPASQVSLVARYTSTRNQAPFFLVAAPVQQGLPPAE